MKYYTYHDFLLNSLEWRVKTNSKTTSAMFTGNIRAQLTPGHQLPWTTAEQMKVLETNFKQNKNPNDLEITFIAAEAGMAETDVRIGINSRITK